MAQGGSPAGRSVFVIGASGGVGRQLVPRLVEMGCRVSGTYRRDGDKASIAGAGGDPVRCDLVEDSVDDLAGRMLGHDAVVFSAGGGGDVTQVDQDGAKKAVDAAAAAGLRRFALVSVFMDAWRGDDSPGAGFERYLAAKRAADVHLAASNLDFLIVRPGTLTDDDATGLVDAGVSVAYAPISRSDVAAFLAAALVAEGLDRVAVEITGGGVPIEQAVSRLQQRRPVA